jgi:hypothetical protein
LVDVDQFERMDAAAPEPPEPVDSEATAWGSARDDISEMREALKERASTGHGNSDGAILRLFCLAFCLTFGAFFVFCSISVTNCRSGGGCRSMTEAALEKLSALVSAAVCYVAAIAWMYVAYGEIGIDSSETRPITGLDLVSFFMALVCVTVLTFV